MFPQWDALGTTTPKSLTRLSADEAGPKNEPLLAS
jgi:hypothetical protein